jgi:hypothetical protein
MRNDLPAHRIETPAPPYLDDEGPSLMELAGVLGGHLKLLVAVRCWSVWPLSPIPSGWHRHSPL